MPSGFADIPAEPAPPGVDCHRQVPAIGRPPARSALGTLLGPKVLVVAGGAGLAGGGIVVGSIGGGGGPGSGSPGAGGNPGGGAPVGGHPSGGGPGGITVPEPASLAIMVMAVVALVLVRLRRNR